MRPAFKLPWGVFALTNTKPTQREWVEVDAKQISSKHFTAKNGKVYLVKADAAAARYNNVDGGTITLKPIQQEFTGVFPGSIFSIHSNKKFFTMKILSIAFNLMNNPTKSDFGLSESSSFSPESAYSLALKQENLTEDEEELKATDAWKAIEAKIARWQLAALLPNLPFPNALPEMVAPLSDETVSEMLEASELVIMGNPLNQEDPAAFAVLQMSEVFGDADLSKYQTPADPADAVAALTEETLEAPALGTESAENPDQVATEGEPVVQDVPGQEPVVAAPPAIPAAQPVVSYVPGENFINATTLVNLRESMLETQKIVNKNLEAIDSAIVSGFLKLAQQQDTVVLSTLPAEAETLEVTA